jgi:hypothetical protein
MILIIQIKIKKMSQNLALTEITEEKELQTITFHRENVMFKPEASDLLTLEDSDEQKLPSLNQLLKFIYGFRKEMASVNIHPTAQEKSKRKNLYLLTDKDYEDFEPFKIKIECNWFDPEWSYALHAGFDFFMYVMQDAYQGRSEIADWIRIHIKHLETIPSSFASAREHVRALSPFLRPAESYFHNIPIEHTKTVSFRKMSGAMSFKTELFNQSVNDACKVMLKIAARKDSLKVVKEKD